jgi:hypothetical protein
MKNFKYLAMAMIAAAVLFTACDKDDDNNDPAPTTTDKNVVLVVKPTIGNQVIALNTDYDINGQTVNFDRLKFYLSNIELMDDAGNVLADNGGIPVLVSTDGAAVTIGATDAEHFHMLRFGAGVDSLANTGSPITNPFPLDDVEMHWNWNPGGGYKSFVMEGSVDSNGFVTHAAAGAEFSNVIYQDGIMVDAHGLSAAGNDIQIEMRVDIAEMLEGLTIPAGPSMGTAPLNRSYMEKLGTGSPFTIE